MSFAVQYVTYTGEIPPIIVIPGVMCHGQIALYSPEYSLCIERIKITSTRLARQHLYKQIRLKLPVIQCKLQIASYPKRIE